MSRIKGTNTGPELLLRKALWHAGLRFRLYAKLPGKPDIVFPGKKVVIFVDGCFWYGCPLHATHPKGNKVFWDRKLLSNVARDQRDTAALESAGWVVLRFWEHEVEGEIDSVLNRTRETLSKQMA